MQYDENSGWYMQQEDAWTSTSVSVPSTSQSPDEAKLASSATTPSPVAIPPAEPHPAKKANRRACDPCRLRRVKCDRAPGQHDCIKCQALQIKCIDSVPRARTSQKGARIAQAKMLYGDASGASGSAVSATFSIPSGQMVPATLVRRSGKAEPRSLYPGGPSTTFPWAEVDLAHTSEMGALISQLIHSISRMRISYFPLLRWINIAAEFEAAGSSLLGMDPVNQALYLGLAAISARTANSAALVGQNAPSLSDVGTRKELRLDNSLCTYGQRREALATDLFNAFITRVNENGVFALATMRSAVTLTLAEMLIQVWREPICFGTNATNEARTYSAAAAEAIRGVGENFDDGIVRDYGFYSVTWTSVIRDSLVAATTGRGLHYSLNELQMLLNIDMAKRMPTVKELCDSWAESNFEGKELMRLWTLVIIQARALSEDASSPWAMSKPRLKMDLFEPMWATFALVRQTLEDATAATLQMAPKRGQPFPDQVAVMRYCMDWTVARANALVRKRCGEEDLARARTADPFSFGQYRLQLQALRLKAAEEAFQAARRVVGSIQEVFLSRGGDAAEFFIPGYFIYEGINSWAEVLIAVSTKEEGGRDDYTLETKIKEVQALREALAVTGWSSASVLPLLRIIDSALTDMRLKLIQITPTQQNSSPPPVNVSLDQYFQFYTFENGADSLSGVDNGAFAQYTNLPQSNTTNPSDMFGGEPSGATADWIDQFLKQQGLDV